MTLSQLNATKPQSARLHLAADVGGTKTLLHLRRQDADGSITVLDEQRYPSAEFDSLDAMIHKLLQQHGGDTPDSACLAVAGPVNQEGDGQTARLTNLPWQLDSRQLEQSLGIPHIALLNDFQAIGYSLDALPPHELVSLHQAEATSGAPRLVVGAGTGLGVCSLFPSGSALVSYPSEGGHQAFAPRGEQQQRLLRFMQQGLERVSYERLVSGTGLVNIYRFLLEEAGRGDSDPLLQQADPAAAIGERAMANDHPLAAEAVGLFCEIYGAFTGDLALNILPTGGIYIAGGIAPKLLERLRDGRFTKAYLDKGRMSELVHGFPVQVITNPNAGLLGAATYAARL